MVTVECGHVAIELDGESLLWILDTVSGKNVRLPDSKIREAVQDLYRLLGETR